MCAVSGVLVMALPIPIVVDNFGDYYAEQKRLEQAELKKEAQELEAKMVRRQELTLQVSRDTYNINDYNKKFQTSGWSRGHGVYSERSH